MHRLPRWVLVLLLFGLSFWFYRGLRFGSFHDDLHDYQQFLEQRIHATSDADFLWKVISFDRIRSNDSKVNFLFRPGLFAWLAVQDIYAREHLALGGWISILLHCLVVVTLFLLLTRFAPSWLAFILSAFFATYSQGAFMILWRMIVPYTIALLAFVAGTWLLFKSESLSSWQRSIGAGLLFLFSALFNETAAFWVPAAGFLILLSARRGTFEKSRYFAFFFPPLAFFVASLTDLLLRAPEGGLFSSYFAPFSGTSTGPFYFALLAVVRVLQSLGYYTLPFFIPQGASLSVADSQVIHLILGAVLVGLGGWAIKQHLPWLRAGERGRLFWFFLLGYPFWIILMVGVFRVTTRGYFYLGASSYYCYTVGFFLTLASGVLLAGYLPFDWRGAQRWWLPLVIILFINQALFSFGRLQKTIAVQVPAQRERQQQIARASHFLRNDRCLVWSEKYLRSNEALAPIYLYRQSCDVKKGNPISLDELKLALNFR